MRKLLVVLFVLAPLTAFATPLPVPAEPNYPALLGQLLALVTVLVTYFSTEAVKAILPKIPKITIPFIAIGLGAVVAYLTTLATGGNVSVYAAVFLGVAATWVDNIKSLLQGKRA